MDNKACYELFHRRSPCIASLRVQGLCTVNTMLTPLLLFSQSLSKPAFSTCKVGINLELSQYVGTAGTCLAAQAESCVS